MKKIVYILFLALLVIACKQKESKNNNVIADVIEDSFVLPQGATPMWVENDQVFVQTRINDTIFARLFFDTGGAASFSLWSDFAIENHIAFDIQKTQKSAENNLVFTAATSPVAIRLGNAPLEYSRILVGKKFIENADGIFCPNYKTDQRIWELNFEHNYIKIIDNDTMPPNAISLPFRFSEKLGTKILVRLPMQLCGKNETLFLDNSYIFDTGTPFSCGFIRMPDELNNFIKNQIHIENDFVVKEIRLNDSIQINYGRFAFWKNAPTQLVPTDVIGTLGVNFLKHFNVFIDLKNQRILLQKHNRMYENTHYSNLGFYLILKDTKLFIGNVFENSPAHAAGLKFDDEILEINGIKAEEIDQNQIEKLYRTKPEEPINLLLKTPSGTKSVLLKTYDNPLNYYNKILANLNY